MKTLVISTPAMGKTTLVKQSRTASWANSHGVDFDLKGHNNHSISTRVSSTSLVNDLFDLGHTFVTGFNGSFDYKLLSHPTHIVFVAPVTSEAMQGAVIRSIMRGDSITFNNSLANNIAKWAYGIYSQYLMTKSQLCMIDGCRHKVSFVGITGLHHVISDLFEFNADTGELELIDYMTLITEKGIRTESYMDAKYDAYCIESYEEMLNRRASMFSSRSERELFTRHTDAIYKEHLYAHYCDIDRVNVCWSATSEELVEDFQGHLQDLIENPDVPNWSIKASIDLQEHSCARARISYEYCSTIDADARFEDPDGAETVSICVQREYVFYAF